MRAASAAGVCADVQRRPSCAFAGRVLILSRAVLTRKELVVVAALSLTACAKPTEVELRLYPCGEPVRVELAVQGYDAVGEALAPLSASFAISDSGVFGDGYATVGLKKPEGMVTADFTLTWLGPDDAEVVVTLADVAVPAVGEVLELDAKDCVPVGETTTELPTSTGTSAGPGETTSETTATATSETTTTGATEMATSDTSTTGTTEVETTESSSSSSSSTTGEESMVGESCVMEGVKALYCEHSGPGLVGDVLVCDGQNWQPGIEECKVETWCSEVGFTNLAVVVGCNGLGPLLACVCQEMDVDTPCTAEDQGCDGNFITLCHDAGEGPRITKAKCASACKDKGDPQQPYCE